MSLRKKFKDAWRKNVPELVAWWNGDLPQFVTAPRPREPLGGVPVFCYHVVDAESFRADLRFLRHNNYTTLSASELVQYLEGTRDVPQRSVVLAFDDGPRNFHDVAFPLLREFDARAVAFIAPGLHADAAAGDDVEARPMTWQEIQVIHASGLVEFQSHTLESRFVPQWPRPAALAGCDPEIEAPRRGPALPFVQDLAASREMIQAHLPGARVEQLAFPMYVGSEAAVSSARQLGFTACHWGIVSGRALNRRGDSPFHICRISDEFLRRLPGEGRASLAQIVRERLRRARLGRDWRQRYGELPV